ncbi:RDD family protein [Methyloprofundus sp.]|uniref:RDD family protein n=1 Tax=Methyloprofundus sp. TaxID=2020875 RepID=UPI003D14C2AD
MAKQKSRKPGATTSPAKPGFFRYIAALFYDLILVIAMLLFATAIFHTLNGGTVSILSSFIVFRLYLLCACFLFYGWFWTHGGQTLGLRAWKLRLVNEHQADISWKQALIRFLTASCSWLACGLGFFWRVWQKDGKTWHDLSSKSYLIVIEPNATDLSHKARPVK